MRKDPQAPFRLTKAQKRFLELYHQNPSYKEIAKFTRKSYRYVCSVISIALEKERLWTKIEKDQKTTDHETTFTLLRKARGRSQRKDYFLRDPYC